MSEPVGALAYSEMRDVEKNPYSADEKRVAEYVVKLTGVGAGNDPIGFLMASHATLVKDIKNKTWCGGGLPLPESDS
jgi:hypothetical protein